MNRLLQKGCEGRPGPQHGAQRRHLHLALVVLGALPFTVLAQEGLPVGMKVRTAPGKAAAWSLTIRERTPERPEPKDEESTGIARDDSRKKGRERRRADYVITGNTGRAITKDAGGERVEIYLFRREGETLLLTWLEKARRVVPYNLDQYSGPEMRFGQRYPGVDWVRPADYRGVVERRGTRCHHFSLEPANDTSTDGSTEAALAYSPRFGKTLREAWFDTMTGLPLAFRDGETEGTFRHRPAPTKPVALPAAHQEALRYYFGLAKQPPQLQERPVTALLEGETMEEARGIAPAEEKESAPE